MPRDINLVEYEHTPARYRGHPAEVYFRNKRFLLAAQGFFSRSADIRAFHQLPALCMQPETTTRPFTAFTLFDCSFAADMDKGQIKMPFILFL